jgi:hypothetical protein
MTALEQDGMRRELDQLSGWMVRLEQRVDAMDQLGTRGMGSVLVQVAELAKDVGELGGEQRSWQRLHREQHDSELAQRTSGRRWLITLELGNAAALLGPWLVLLIHH